MLCGLANSTGQEPRQQAVDGRANSDAWPQWSDLVADLESSAKIRGLVLAVHMKGPGENLRRLQAIALSIKARPAASDALQQVSNWSGVRTKSMTATVEVVPFIRRREDRRRCES